ncbi:ABC transporter ATP-binding protein [Pelagibacterium sp. 26DY04]|uniref:ABC transporter ATP-binding protein n=1 Tax=Pelagibacterium sp. 26DY04 TaxID=2967130 RepID=UPI002814E2DB|nr:ABC transporter ATP-binding protein [Pelagibacterium sp. 26DY04]WMT86817.1 ABC transporter ATP-binding protein [Pelagibacterium sp. 26DY04]
MNVVRFPEGDRSKPMGAEPKVLLTFNNVEKRFVRPDGSVSVAADGVSLAIEEHKFVAVIGPSGCGKTTLLRLANGLIEPDAGEVTIEGRAPVPGPDMGFVFQAFRLIPWASVQGNVEFALESLPLSRAERAERARAYLDLVGLSRSANSYPAQLSGGMKQRVALARALAGEPRVLLMDEPFASLDAQTRELMQSELLAIWRRRMPTVMFVTHSVDEALVLADTIVVMGAGKILEQIEVDLPRPRNSAQMRGDARFIELRNYLWARIRELVLSDPASEFFGRNLNE